MSVPVSPTPEPAVRAFFDTVERFGRSDAGLRKALDAAVAAAGDPLRRAALTEAADVARRMSGSHWSDEPWRTLHEMALGIAR